MDKCKPLPRVGEVWQSVSRGTQERHLAAGEQHDAVEAMVHGGGGLVAGAGLRSSTFRLNVSTFRGIRWVSRGVSVTTTAHVEVKGGRVEAPA